MRGGRTPPPWLVASGLGVAQMVAFGSTTYHLTIVSGPIHEDTGWPIQWIMAGLSIGALVGATVAPRAGRWIRSRGGKPALSLSSLAFAAGLLVMAAAVNLPMYLAGWALTGIGTGIGLYDAIFGTLGRLYGLAARRPITTVTLWGGFTSTLSWPISGLLVTAVGWRWSCVAYAVMHIVVLIVIYRFMLPDAEPEAAATPEATLAADAPLSADARRAVLCVAMTLITQASVVSILSVNLMQILAQRGLSLGQAIALGTFIGPAQVASRLIEGVFAARYHPSATMLLAMVCLASSPVLLAIVPMVAAPVVMVVFGIGLGLVSVARGALPLYLFGPYRAPVIAGKLGRPMAIAQAAAPFIGAWAIAHIGGRTTLYILSVLALSGVTAAVFLRTLGDRLAAETP